MDVVASDVLLALWKVHILHHAASGALYNLWMIEELAKHGYHVSPGTLYPLLSRMERNGWLRSGRGAGSKARRNFRITTAGRRVLDGLREQIVVSSA